jgi:exodeoxyribonuclease V alpha subunit
MELLRRHVATILLKCYNLQNNPARGIFNGDLGIVESFDPVKDEATVKFHDATMLCEAQLLRHMDLAYALTAHKSQGSEYPAVVIVLVKGHFVLLNRNLLYTAMTRAQRHLILVAQKGATYLAVKDAPRPRLTKLAALIRDAVTQ